MINSSSQLDRTVSLAPMLRLTDRHFRFFLRQISPKPLLYTEMIPANALILGKEKQFLKYHESERPLALQLGGNDINIMAEAAKIGEDYGYNEININAGCPSDRVAGAGLFGASLIKEPVLLAKIFSAMQKKVKVPVTIKTRIGIKPNDNYQDLENFIKILSSEGCKTFIIHARSAVLKNLSPKKNRKLVPLRPEIVYQIKQAFPKLEIIFNGGIINNNDVINHLKYVDGVMIGEALYKNPLLLADIYSIPKNRQQIIFNMAHYIEYCEQEGIKTKYILRHLGGLFYETPHASKWKKALIEISKLDKFDKNRLIESIAEI